MIANSSTLACSGSDGYSSAAPNAGSLSQREEKPSSFENLLGQARSQRATDRSTRGNASGQISASRSKRPSTQPADSSEDTADDAAPSVTTPSGPEKNAADPSDSSAVEDRADTQASDKHSAHRPASVESPAQIMCAAIALANLNPPASAAPATVPVAAASAPQPTAAPTAVPAITVIVQIPATAIPAAVPAVTISAQQPASADAPSGSAPIVPHTPATVQSQESLLNVPNAASAVLSPLKSSGNPSDSHLGLATGSGVGNVTNPLQLSQGVSTSATTTEAASSTNLSVVSPSSSPAGSERLVPLETHISIALPARVQNSADIAPKAITQQTGSDENAAKTGDRMNGIERLLVFNEEPQAKSAGSTLQSQPATGQQTAAGPNLPALESNTASGQSSQNSGNGSPELSGAPAASGLADAAFTPVTVSSDPSVLNISPTISNSPTAIVNTWQDTPVRETSSKASGQAPSVSTNTITVSGTGHQAASSQSSADSSNDNHDSQQNPEQSPARQAHAEPFHPSTDGVTASTTNASGTISSTGAATTSPTQNLERYQIAEQVTRHLDSLRLKNGHGDITLDLMPAHLGSVRVTISTSEHGVAARIMVETSQAQHAMESAKDSLRTALESRGLNLSSLDVSLGQHTSGNHWGNPSRQQELAQESADRIAGRAFRESGSADSVPEVTVAAARNVNQPTGSSRLDYRA